MKGLRNNGGFSLVEVVVSIAILAVISVIILDIYVVAERANRRAQDTDIALGMAITVAEEYKAAKLPTPVPDGYSAMSGSDSEWDYAAYYSTEWIPCGKNEARFASYLQEISNESDTGVLLEVRIQFVDLEGTEAYKILTDITTKKYFSHNRSVMDRGGAK